MGEKNRSANKISIIEPTEFKKHPNDCGSPEFQIARLTSRISQISIHLQEHRQDHSTKRGLTMIIGKRARILRYLERNNRPKYLKICDTLGIKKSFGISISNDESFRE